jgi:hypothetical protein
MSDPRIESEIEAAYAERQAQLTNSSEPKWKMPFFRDDYRDQMQERAQPSAELMERLDRLADEAYGSWDALAESDVDGRAR